MIEADETPGGIPAPEPEEERGLAPGKAFLILLAALVAGAALVLIFTSGGDDAPDEAERRPAFQLTDEQALERFHELWALDERARTERDPSLISLIYTSDSESGRGAADAIRGYLQDGVYDRSEVELIEASVVSNSARQIEIETTTHYTPCLVDENGQSVMTREPVKIRMQTTWRLGPDDNGWRVTDIATFDDRVIDRSPPLACD